VAFPCSSARALGFSRSESEGCAIVVRRVVDLGYCVVGEDDGDGGEKRLRSAQT
jgi:hypothetical protein